MLPWWQYNRRVTLPYILPYRVYFNSSWNLDKITTMREQDIWKRLIWNVNLRSRSREAEIIWLFPLFRLWGAISTLVPPHLNTDTKMIMYSDIWSSTGGFLLTSLLFCLPVCSVSVYTSSSVYYLLNLASLQSPWKPFCASWMCSNSPLYEGLWFILLLCRWGPYGDGGLPGFSLL